ncbi:MAG: ABC transporter permease [Gammaproteobacteria bacterium]|nr:ABC transporter permease [Gammaproteobacteria bacterium]
MHKEDMDTTAPPPAPVRSFELRPLQPGEAQLVLAGEWRLQHGLPDIAPLMQQLTQQNQPGDGTPPLRQLRFDTTAISDWDSSLVVFLHRLLRHCQECGIDVDQRGLTEGVQRLLTLATAAPARSDADVLSTEESLLQQVGESTLDLLHSAPRALRFIGDSAIALLNTLRGRARFRSTDVGLLVQDAGPNALPIVSLISFLVGLILAYMGAAQLALFGAEIYIADLVGIGMVREVGALMTAVILAGRTGAAYAAEIGTMQVNEEIDALRTLGISPIEFLVLPRLLALVMMIPLLTLYANLVGILAGMTVASTIFDISIFEYYVQTLRILDMNHILVGLSKALVYGICIAIAGCLRGIQCGRSAAAVGQATTSAVVTSIVFIVISASALTIIYQQLGV